MKLHLVALRLLLAGSILASLTNADSSAGLRRGDNKDQENDQEPSLDVDAVVVDQEEDVPPPKSLRGLQVVCPTTYNCPYDTTPTVDCPTSTADCECLPEFRFVWGRCSLASGCDYTCPENAVRTPGVYCYNSFSTCDCAFGFEFRDNRCQLPLGVVNPAPTASPTEEQPTASPTLTPPVATGFVGLAIGSRPSYCVDLINSNLNNGAVIGLGLCTGQPAQGQPNQLWLLDPTNRYIRSALDVTKCIQPFLQAPLEGTNAVIFDCVAPDTPIQQFTPNTTTAQLEWDVTTDPKLCLDGTSGFITMEPCDADSYAQRFYIPS